LRNQGAYCGARQWVCVIAVIVAAAVSSVAGQTWPEAMFARPRGVIALHQAILDASSDALVMLVASHPDDRYVAPAVWLRHVHGVRVAVLLATRGGGGQNSAGPETGDDLERIRTLETEAGCAMLGASAWYLNRPDAGFRRSSAEAFAEWGRDVTIREMARLIRTIRPDAIVTTHHSDESHGHDQALVEALPLAIELAADASFEPAAQAYRVHHCYVGCRGNPGPHATTIPLDVVEPLRGSTLRRLAYQVLQEAHRSPGPLAPMDQVFTPDLALEPIAGPSGALGNDVLRDLPTVFDDGVWTGDPAERDRLRTFLGTDLARLAHDREGLVTASIETLRRLRSMAATADVGASAETAVFATRLRRRIDALERVVLHACSILVETETAQGAAAIAGEELDARVSAHVGGHLPITAIRCAGVGGVSVELVPSDSTVFPIQPGQTFRALATARMPVRSGPVSDPMGERFRADRFRPPVSLQFHVTVGAIEIPAGVDLRVAERAPVEVTVVPRMLLLPAGRSAVQFNVGVVRNTPQPIEHDLEVQVPAGYSIQQARRRVALTDQRSESFGYEVGAPADRKAGVDALRIRLGAAGLVLPIHKVDVAVPSGLRVGVIRSRDDTLPGVLGVGGLGLRWADLSDLDVAVGDLTAYDTIVVDIRALRDRPDVRRGFRRLLDFAATRARRLVVFYHKDVEFHPPGEAFLGAPFAPFQVGRARVTRADAPVRVLRPDHVLMTTPNLILARDWDGWEQERGLYFPSSYSERYEEVLETSDAGQPLERGALLYARTGDGEYVYCALALWRQLKKLHPGAVRLLANLLSPKA
jgi:LmbE family N-acetylglucosaminyl deacetylase